MDITPTYPERIRTIARIFERNEREQGRNYALRELCTMLNAVSNEALQERQRAREEIGI